MLKEFVFVFFGVWLCLVEDGLTASFHPSNGQPISQWSGQINGFDMDHVRPGNNMSNGSSSGSNGNGSNGSGSNESGSNGSGSNGSGSNGSGSNGSGGNGGSQIGNGFGNGFNNGMTSWQWGNGNSSGTNGNGWNNNGLSWSNSTSSSFGAIQNQADEYPGSGYPSMYYQQYSQSLVMPTPAANPQEYARPPNANNMQNHVSNGGNSLANNNPSGFQFSGCMPSSGSNANPGAESFTPSSSETTTFATPSENEVTTAAAASTRKRTKH